MPSEKEKMLAGELYRPGDAEIQAEQAANKAWLVRYNAALGQSPAERRVLLREHFGAVGEDAVIRPPFFCDFGYNIRLGAGVFLNFNCVILDVTEVSIGASHRSGPRCRSTRPTIRAIRRRGMQASSSAGPCASGAMSGSAAARSSFRA